MSGIKKERWTEEEIVQLPAGEHDYFDRKSGEILSNYNKFRDDLAKALSAFANSGGGHLILGVENNGIIDGIDPVRGNTPIREWLEQLIPNLLNYPLENFRVHEVEPSIPSQIPSGKAVIVIDVGDSSLAPHQTSKSRTYYYREGSHSKPAPHFYLEMLRNRLVGALLVAELKEIKLRSARADEAKIEVDLNLSFKIQNEGRVAAYNWYLVLKPYKVPKGREADFNVYHKKGVGGKNLDEVILPGLWRNQMEAISITFRPNANSKKDVMKDLSLMLSSTFELGFRVVSETNPGEERRRILAELIDKTELVNKLSSLVTLKD